MYSQSRPTRKWAWQPRNRGLNSSRCRSAHSPHRLWCPLSLRRLLLRVWSGRVAKMRLTCFSVDVNSSELSLRSPLYIHGTEGMKKVNRSYVISHYNRYEFLVNGTCYDAFRVTRKRYTEKGAVLGRNCVLLSSVLMRGRKILRKNALGMFMIGIISAYLWSSAIIALGALDLKLNLCVVQALINLVCLNWLDK
jgi:hypothetical protein